MVSQPYDYEKSLPAKLMHRSSSQEEISTIDIPDDEDVREGGLPGFPSITEGLSETHYH